MKVTELRPLKVYPFTFRPLNDVQVFKYVVRKNTIISKKVMLL